MQRWHSAGSRASLSGEPRGHKVKHGRKESERRPKPSGETNGLNEEITARLFVTAPAV